MIVNEETYIKSVQLNRLYTMTLIWISEASMYVDWFQVYITRINSDRIWFDDLVSIEYQIIII